jgi:hypothetical protein
MKGVVGRNALRSQPEHQIGLQTGIKLSCVSGVLRVQKFFHSKQHMDYSANSCTVKITVTPKGQDQARPKQAKTKA